MISWIKKQFQRPNVTLQDVADQLQLVRLALGRIESRSLENETRPNRNEFQVYSQDGEDGLIQFLIRQVPIENKVFVEFGVTNYQECNTRFLLEKDHWSGLIIDESAKNLDLLKSETLFWRRDLKAKASFITRENINDLISGNGITGDIGLLSIDIDGNDYWVWDAINCIQPRIVICEYNNLWGPTAAVSTPYSPTFYRTKAHYSNLYFGASLAALESLGKKKGYTLVASNMFGTNAFFVRSDLLSNLIEVTAKKAWVPLHFRQSRGEDGHLTFLSASDGLKLLADQPLVDVLSGKNVQVRDLPSV